MFLSMTRYDYSSSDSDCYFCYCHLSLVLFVFQTDDVTKSAFQAALATVGGKGGGQPLFGWQSSFWMAVFTVRGGFDFSVATVNPNI